MNWFKRSWLKRIDRAEKAGHFSDADIADANQWPTCAVGSKRSALEKVGVSFHLVSGAPVDQAVYSIGTAFYYAVKHHNFKEARQLHMQLLALTKTAKQRRKRA